MTARYSLHIKSRVKCHEEIIFDALSAKSYIVLQHNKV